MMNRSRPAVALLSFFLLGLPACRSYEFYTIENLPPESRIIVDGRIEDWRGSLSMIEGGDASLGVSNDKENLYVCLVAESSLLQAQIMATGVTVWFDPHGGTKKILGIRYLGRAIEEARLRQAGETDRNPSPGDPFGNEPSGLEIIRSGKSDFRDMETVNALGIEAKFVPTAALVAYELKIPLLPTEAHPLAVGAPPGQLIGLGIDTSDPHGRKTVRRPLGGMPPMGGGSGWERGGVLGGYDLTPDIPGRLKIWGRVRLSPSREGALTF